MEEKKEKVRISDYLYILFKWRKFLIINLLIVIVASTLYAFLLPKHYKSTAIVMMPPEGSMGLGGLTSLLGGRGGSASLGARLLGYATGSEDILLGIINSRTAITDVIEKFGLFEYYGIDDNNFDKVLRLFSKDLNAETNEFGMIEISVINKSPQTAADIANYFVRILDSLNIRLNIEQAKNNRMFVEQRYFQNVDDLRSAEDSLYKFQKKYGIVAIPEQLEVSVKAAAEIEAQLVARELYAKLLKEQFSDSSPQYQGVMIEVELLRKRVLELKNSDKLSSVSNVLFPFKLMPDIAIQYLRLYREIELQQTIMEFILPLYEQAKVEEQKSIPTVMLLDKAAPAQLKHSPKRAFIILGFIFFAIFIFVPLIFWFEQSINLDKFSNPLQEKSKNIVQKIKRFYRIKLN